MRDIHCRGRNSDTGEWEIGYLVVREQDFHGTPKYFLQQFGGRWLPVDEDTIGQYTGRKSIDGQKVYEGDLMQMPGSTELRSVVRWNNLLGAWQLDLAEQEYGKGWAKIGMVGMMQVIGNIHDEVAA